MRSNNTNNNNNQQQSATTTTLSGRQLIQHVNDIDAQRRQLVMNEKTLADRVDSLKNDQITKMALLRQKENQEQQLRLRLQELASSASRNKSRVQEAVRHNNKIRIEEPILHRIVQEDCKVIKEENNHWVQDGLQQIEHVKDSWGLRSSSSSSSSSFSVVVDDDDNNNKNHHEDTSLLKSNNNNKDDDEDNIPLSSSKKFLINQLKQKISDQKKKNDKKFQRVSSLKQESENLHEEIAERSLFSKKLDLDIEEQTKKINQVLKKKQQSQLKLDFLTKVFLGGGDDNDKNNNINEDAAATDSSIDNNNINNTSSSTSQQQQPFFHHQIEQTRRSLEDGKKSFDRNVVAPLEHEIASLSKKQQELEQTIHDNLHITLKALNEEVELYNQKKNSGLCDQCSGGGDGSCGNTEEDDQLLQQE